MGRETVRLLVSRGATVFAFDVPGAFEGAATEDSVWPVEADVTDAAAVVSAVGRVAEVAEATGAPLRYVVSCAGVAPSQRILGRKGMHDLELFARVVAVNLIGTFNIMTAAAVTIAKAEPDENGGRGVIVNTASISAFDGQIGQAAYAASKAGVAGLTLPAARDLAQSGIRVCTVAPGLIDTPMFSAFPPEVRSALAEGVPFPSRLGRPDEFAAFVEMVIEHDYLNGETIRMDGALRMAPR